MPDSAFLGITDDDVSRILFVKRKDSIGSWYLPGGGFQKGHTGPEDAFEHWIPRQLTFLGTIDSVPMGHWKLSQQAGGHKVFLEHVRPEMDPMDLDVHYGSLNKYIHDVAMFNEIQIHNHLNHTRLLPWGQAKLAMSILRKAEVADMFGPFDGKPLKADLGRIGGIDWVRPN